MCMRSEESGWYMQTFLVKQTVSAGVPNDVDSK